MGGADRSLRFRSVRLLIGIWSLGLLFGGLFDGAVQAQDVPTLVVMQNWPKGFDNRSPEYEDEFWARAERELGFKIDMVYAVSHGDFVDKLPVMAASGSAPDVVLYADLSHYALGLFEPLNSYIERSGFPIDDFFPASVDFWTSDGQIYALPTSRNHAIFVYNKDHFSRAGIADPPAAWGADAGWTWEYVRDVAQKLTQSSGDEVSVYGIEDQGWVGVWPLYWGADWADEHGSITAASPETVRVVEFMVDFYRSGYRGGNLMQGTASMTNGFSWTVNSYVASGLNLAFAPTPIGDRHVTETWTDGAAILNTSQNKELAWKFLEWLFQPENAVGFYTKQWNYLVPMRGIREIWEDHMRASLGNVIFTNNYASVLFEAGPYGGMTQLLSNLIYAPLWGNVRSGSPDNMLFGQLFWDALDGTIPVSSWLAESQRLLQNALVQAQGQ